jgi:NADH:ubiquinone oxidoreductase subunit 3 (subunit A)
MNVADLFLFPPVAFCLFFAIGLLVLWGGRILAAKGKTTQGKHAQYACGEDIPAARVQPDYTVFFPFALFFTILDVTALILALLPPGNIALMGLLYMVGIAISLFTLGVR